MTIARFLVLFAILFASPVTAQTDYSKLYVFGDSLVDSGNAFIATGGAEASPVDGFYAGRFSNGYNFADYLSTSLVGTLATPALLGGTNFAVGGATTAPVPGTIPGLTSPSFVEQVGLYGTLVGEPIPSDALVLVTFSGNDVRSTINMGGMVTFTDAATSLTTGLNLLYASGARNFLITGSPDIGLLPRSVQDVGAIPGRLDELTSRSQEISSLFAQTSAAFAGQTGANVEFFDLFGFEHAVRADPAAYGLPADLDLTTPCQVINGGIPQLSNCTKSLYFDKVHPTTVVHQAIANALVAQLSGSPAAVPEPATWLMMIAGFGVLGIRLRRARRTPSLAI